MKSMKTNLKDVTFLVILKVDTIERLENFLTCISFLLKNFDTNIKVLEVDSFNNGIVKKLLNKRIKYSFVEDDDPILFRTKYLNDMMNAVNTPFIAVWDADVLLQPEQIIETMSILRSGEADFILPYEKKMLDTSPIIRKLFLKKNRITFLLRNMDKMKEMYPPEAVGGAFFCKLDAYIKLGLENENFYGWGMEDGERYIRWKFSIYKTKRIKGVIFHLSHPRGVNSFLSDSNQSNIKLGLLEAASRKAYFEKV